MAQGTGVNKDIVVIAEQGTHSAVFMPGGRARWGQPGGTVQVSATPIPPLCPLPIFYTQKHHINSSKMGPVRLVYRFLPSPSFHTSVKKGKAPETPWCVG